MCGRYTQRQSADAIAKQFQLKTVPDSPPRYNIAPTQLIAAVTQPKPSSQRRFRVFQWGLVPFWVKDASLGAKPINARAETVAQKPSFRAAFRHRRCLILADGFYEWQRVGSAKQPHFFHLQDDQPFAFAGLWEQWESPQNEILETCTILTTEANEVVRPVHRRMPVMLHPDDYDQWIDPSLNVSSQLLPLLRPYPADEMAAYPVSKKVNRVSSDRPECIEPLPAE
ncbi:SOS response-associated peptidase [Leptolyngbyaceae cyanobacterium UHCC 1019]